MTIADTTEAVFPPLPVGYIEPAEQILSEDESEPVYIPVADRYWRNRIYRSKHGTWHTAAPVGDRRFKLAAGGFIEIQAHWTYEEALATCRRESALDQAKRDNAEIKAHLYRDVIR